MKNEISKTKKLLASRVAIESHWVGDGFPVRTIFTYNDFSETVVKDISPFLLMDYGGPFDFKPSKGTRGVGEHPHRGFETVTIVYSGEVEHRDSAGGGGHIGPDEVQWMTAASGVVHEEKHGQSFLRSGGRFEMVQLWVNLPARSKMTKPRYQGLRRETIPTVPMDGGAVRVIAGQFGEIGGPAKTFTRVNLWDLRFAPSSKVREVELIVPDGDTAALFVLDGKIGVGMGETLGAATLAVFERAGDRLNFTLLPEQGAKLLFLGGEPIHEPVVGYGPFVMNTYEEIQQAMIDYQNGRMGQLPQE